MQITKIEASPIKNKRYRVTMTDGKHYDFGLKNGSTYLEHKDPVKRTNYLKRHMGNETEKYLIENYIPSPSLFSALLLWGYSTDLDKNIKFLNSAFRKLY
jgi:hypothetical protein